MIADTLQPSRGACCQRPEDRGLNRSCAANCYCATRTRRHRDCQHRSRIAISCMQFPGSPLSSRAPRLHGARYLRRQQRGYGIVRGPVAAQHTEHRPLAHPAELHYAIAYWIGQTLSRRRRQRGPGQLTLIEFEFALISNTTQAAA